jgi:hypothetical protein
MTDSQETCLYFSRAVPSGQGRLLFFISSQPEHWDFFILQTKEEKENEEESPIPDCIYCAFTDFGRRVHTGECDAGPG